MTESEMIIAIKSGGRQQDMALQALYRKAVEFQRFFVHKGASRPDAEDWSQEVVYKIFANAATFTGDGGFGDGSANAWMWTIARNELYSKFRSKEPDAISIDSDGLTDAAKAQLDAEISETGSERTSDREAERCVASGIEDFAAVHPDHARALEMQMDGLSIVSITSLIGRASAGATKVFLHTCRVKLSPFIAHCLPLLKP